MYVKKIKIEEFTTQNTNVSAKVYVYSERDYCLVASLHDVSAYSSFSAPNAGCGM